MPGKTAEEMALDQKEISVAEFFEKNRHLLGFDNPAKALITVVKEGVDNSLDACQEGGKLPHIRVNIDDIGKNKYEITLKDNGPGIVKREMPSIFGKLLYGSKFHTRKQSLLPQEKILLKEDGEVQLIEIGNFCDQVLQTENGSGTEKVEDVEAPCFNKETGEIKWREVTHVIRHENENEAYRIKTSRNREIEVTGNHSLFTLSDEGKVEEVEASKLGGGDYVIAPKNIPKPKEVESINILDYFIHKELEDKNWYVYGIESDLLERIRKEGDKVRKRPSPESRKRTYYRINGVDILKDSLDQNYLKKNYLPAEKVLDLGWEERVEECDLRTYKAGGKTTEIPVKITLTKNFMRLLGFFVAEGHLGKSQAGLTFGSHETGLIQEARKDISNTFNVSTTTVQRERNSTRLKVFGSPVIRLLEKFCGRGAKNKRIPEIVFHTFDELQEAFISALFESDGSNAHPSNELSYATTSKQLAQELSALLQMKGIVSSWKEMVIDPNISDGATKIYNIIVYGKDIEKLKAFSCDPKLTSRYRRIPSKLLEKYAVGKTYKLSVKPTRSGIFTALGLGSSPKYSKEFVKKISKILEGKNVEEDYYLKTLKEHDLVSEGGEATEELRKIWEVSERFVRFANSDLCLLKVKDVERAENTKYVYDVSVPGSDKDENFLAGNRGLLFVKNSRGQQGIGISASVLYSQLTTGKPAIITSKTDESSPAKRFELKIDTVKNEPEILKEEELDDGTEPGTEIKLTVEGKYLQRYHSVDEYLKQTAIANPYAHIEYTNPEGESFDFERGAEELPQDAKEIKPHPYGVELGVLARMLKDSEANKVISFLQNEFTRVGRTSAEEICMLADIDPDDKPQKLSHSQQEELLEAMQKVKIQRPPTNCLSPIGKDLIKEGLEKEIDAEFITSTSRDPEVYRGDPFQVECGIAYGGELEEEENEKVKVMRYANKVPLLYQASSCAITKALEKTDWKRYGLDQPGGNGTPKGPAVIFVHLCSTWVPFTSESKESIARYPKIVKEIKLALQEAARDLKRHISKKERGKKEKRREKIFNNYLPLVVENAAELAGTDEKLDSDSILKQVVDEELVKKAGDSKEGEEDG